MQSIINEWQLGSNLNHALQQHQRADFALWLALLSPAVNEMAAFYTPQSNMTQPTVDLYQHLAVRPSRSFAWSELDGPTMQHLNQAAQRSLNQLKLQSALTPEPWVVTDNPKKLDGRLLACLDTHCLRRLESNTLTKSTTDETALYEMLQQLEASQQVAS